MSAADLNHIHHSSATDSDSDTGADLLFMLAAVAGAVAGAILGTVFSEQLLAGEYTIALSVFGSLAGCWGLALLAVFAYFPLAERHRHRTSG